jgi:hypothetical protein
MNATMTAPSRYDHPPQPLLSSRPVRRVGLVDRLALRVGLALIMWNRRPARVRTERLVTREELVELHRIEAMRHRPHSLGPIA